MGKSTKDKKGKPETTKKFSKPKIDKKENSGEKKAVPKATENKKVDKSSGESSKLESKVETMDDWDLEFELEDQPGWRPPARKKRVVPESEDEDEEDE
ncbi:hypothetical protein GCK72_025947 [Caenorhabditis remanei]|uniref:Uncharacterized protein n=1 Tax=Caenorhabditis remanei TaxID=31234 RepID=A0A6A5G4R4_CAERE|nr:hypothetical protein GCK72_025947 [Caenorhabditis remanei]KAF1749479.1 hypothetical protein GCK72_025947 [Caenorhabditis remanei]